MALSAADLWEVAASEAGLRVLELAIQQRRTMMVVNRTTQSELRARFPYMFQEIEHPPKLFPGWLPTFVQLCVAIDAVLGPEKRGFHWEEIAERFGASKFFYGLELHGVTVHDLPDGERCQFDVIAALVDGLVEKAESMTARTCCRCGSVGQAINLDGHVWTVCREHSPPLDPQREQIRAYLNELRVACQMSGGRGSSR